MKAQLADRVFSAIIAEGLEDFSADNLAAVAGVSKRTFYKYFDSKDELLSELTERVMQRAAGHFGKYLNDTTLQPLESVYALFRGFPQVFVPPLQRFLFALQRERPDLAQKIFAFRRLQMQRLEQVFDRAVKAGEMRAGLDSRFTLDALLALVERLLVPDYVLQSGQSLEAVFQGIFEIFFHGIAAAQPKAKAKSA